jgi:hypothetical protein
MTDTNLQQLYSLTLLKSKYNAMDYKTRTPLYTKRVQSFKDPYEKVRQLDKNTRLIFNQENTQNLKYDNIKCGRPESEGAYRFNYALDQYITKRLVDVSGQYIRNTELRVQPFLNTTPAKNHKLSQSLEQAYREYYSNDISKAKHIIYRPTQNQAINKFEKDTSLFTPKNYTTNYVY